MAARRAVLPKRARRTAETGDIGLSVARFAAEANRRMKDARANAARFAAEANRRMKDARANVARYAAEAKRAAESGDARANVARCSMYALAKSCAPLPRIR